MSYETLLFEIQDQVAKITINRPDAANSLNLKMAEELLDVSIRCDTDPEIRAVLLTAQGKMFCAGGDLKGFAEAGDQVAALAKRMTTALHGALSRFARMSAPLITAVNGTVAGGGMGLVLCADLVLAAESAKFTMAYTRAGLVPDGSSTYFLPRIVGLRRAADMIFTNPVLDSATALEWQLITRVVPDADLLAEANQLAQKLAQGPLFAHGQVKRLLAQTFQTDFEAQMEAESRGIADAVSGAEGQEGIHAFLEKRKPDFRQA